MYDNLITLTPVSVQTVAAGESYTSAAIPMGALGDSGARPLVAKGFFSVQLDITGDGTAKLEYLCSNDGTNFVAPEGSSAIMTGKTKTTGRYLASFALPVCKAFKLKVTETGGANSIAANVILAALA